MAVDWFTPFAGTMHRKDWLGASTSSHQRKQFKSIGRGMEKGMARSSLPSMR